MTRFPEFDVVGFVLRPEEDGRYTILNVAQFEGKPSVAGVQGGDELLAVDNVPVQGSTLGQVWKMLGGAPGQERKITIERAGKEFVVPATVQHFLGALPEEDTTKKKK
jgi:C-terminal processing protease CtpA/Prc